MHPGSADPSDSHGAPPSEGDANCSPHRRDWIARHLSPGTQDRLNEDAEGRRYLDFHGNNVHQAGFGHPRVIAAIKEQLDRLPFCTRR